jgi:hypothetical protein
MLFDVLMFLTEGDSHLLGVDGIDVVIEFKHLASFLLAFDCKRVGLPEAAAAFRKNQRVSISMSDCNGLPSSGYGAEV